MAPRIPHIFIGSSSEGRRIAELIQALLTDGNSVKISAWWDPSVFPAGRTFVESLHLILGKANAGIFVATPDDMTMIRDRQVWTARGNVLLEYGMFSGVHGRSRVALAVVGDFDLPSDLSGVTHLRLRSADPFLGVDSPSSPKAREKFMLANRTLVSDWIAQVKSAPPDGARAPLEYFPQVAEQLVQAVIRMKTEGNESIPGRDLDLFASDIIGALAASLDSDNFGISESLISKVCEMLLRSCWSLSAIDVLGPRGWVSPSIYRYLAPQLRAYIQANTEISGTWNLQVSKELAAALETSVKNAKSCGELDESTTAFDNPEYFKWSSDEQPRLEFSRVLLWSEKELLSPLADSVIAIHLAFNVPLFFLRCDESDPRRNVDYICFRVKKDVQGFYGLRSEAYRTRNIEQRRVPGIGDPIKHYLSLLSNGGLMFAHDARFMLLARE